MLLWLSQWLAHYLPASRVFQYFSTRYILAGLTALFIALFLGPKTIQLLQQYQLGQMIRKHGPESHLTKKGTPTMGGLLILIGILAALVLWADLSNLYVQLSLFTLCGFGLIGGIDDLQKCRHQNSSGLPARWKYLWQTALAALIIGILYQRGQATELVIPFMKQAIINLGLGYFFLAYLVIVGASNAVNLTDGLDGLAILPIVIVASGLSIFAYAEGHLYFANYFSIPFIPGAGELGVVCAALAGAGLGFLWFNTYPAQVFMGDVGSLALGATLGTIAVCLRQELVFFLMGGTFVLETLSVIFQVAYFKLTGRRIFAMAPLHHHFELKGWPEPRVIIRFWILSVIFVLIGLASLKFR